MSINKNTLEIHSVYTGAPLEALKCIYIYVYIYNERESEREREKEREREM